MLAAVDFEVNKPIEEIKAGDLVYSTDPETGESEYKEVVRTFRKESDVIIHIFINGEEIETTPSHPFWVEDEWVNAKDLREGDVLTLADGSTATITKTYGEQLDEPVIVYNFEVQDFHTYYVTDTGVLVHNADYGSNSKSDSGTQGVGNPVKVEGRGNTGRTIPNTLDEQMAMHQVMSNPLDGAIDMSKLNKHPIIMTDPRWPASEGWVKMSNNVNGIEIHFVYNNITDVFDDFKFK